MTHTGTRGARNSTGSGPLGLSRRVSSGPAQSSPGTSGPSANRSSTRAQLDAILDQSELSGVTVRVIPFDVDGFAGASAELLYAGGRVPALDTAQRDTPEGSAFMDAAARLRSMRTLFRKVEAVSLEPTRSRDYIHRLAKEL
ncbi:Scr1 family TA system antitoxin-like transcriptional regulator [Streptomyces sp. NPDC050535]|uniref:Scr1 family TA system antitoxin-like transcriptional regulator n=1 Tax=Streptomyces sp. NPDC050535 TaxID=3365626 RepID=UPI003797DC8D